MRGLLASYEVQEWRPIIVSPDVWHYRNKMEYAFAMPYGAPGQPDPPKGIVLGQRESGRFDRIVDIETCFLMSPESLEVLHRARQWAKDHQLNGYHRRRHQGDLRYLVIREGKNTEQRMAILLATKAPAAALLADLQARLSSLVTTAWLGVTESPSDVARAQDMRLLWGPGRIEERLGPVIHQISPYSFFQTNTHGAERLYGLLADWGRSIGGTLVDAYCGSGGISLALSPFFDRVIGIDSNRDAIEDARLNAQRNRLDNAEFVADDATDFLKKLPASKLAVQLSALIVDPPRPGLHPKALQTLAELNPPRLAYVSCNPESLARDLQSLVPFYKIQSVQPIDLFPHTPHVETVAFLEHR